MNPRQFAARLAESNRHHPPVLAAVPRAEWPDQDDPRRVGLWRSRFFLVQGFAEDGGVVRLSVNRTLLDTKTGRWKDGITWDELQQLKREAGFGDRFAVEVYPQDCNIVNVGNLRHLWILPQALPFAWAGR